MNNNIIKISLLMSIVNAKFFYGLNNDLDDHTIPYETVPCFYGGYDCWGNGFYECSNNNHKRGAFVWCTSNDDCEYSTPTCGSSCPTNQRQCGEVDFNCDCGHQVDSMEPIDAYWCSDVGCNVNAYEFCFSCPVGFEQCGTTKSHGCGQLIFGTSVPQHVANKGLGKPKRDVNEYHAQRPTEFKVFDDSFDKFIQQSKDSVIMQRVAKYYKEKNERVRLEKENKKKLQLSKLVVVLQNDNEEL